MAYNDKRLKTDLEEKPIPQAYNPDIDDYEPVHSTNNALNQVIYGPNGQPISTVGNKLAVRATELEDLMQGFATEGKLEQVRQLLAGVATENKLEQARVLLNTISTKDFATQTTLAAVLAKLGQLETEIQAVKANQLSGDQKVQLSGTISEILGGIVSSVTPGSSLTLIATRTPRGVLRTVMASTGVNARYHLELRLYGSGSTYASRKLAEDKVGGNTFDVYDLDIAVPRYSLRFTNAGTVDVYLTWSVVEV